jgi:hypothetical protein
LICSDRKKHLVAVNNFCLPRKCLSVLIFGFFVGACSTSPVTPQELNKPKGPENALFRGDLDTVWRAVRKAMSGYPLKRDDQAVGIMETDSMPGTDMWMPPFRDKDIKSTKYNLRLVAQKGFLKGKPVTRVKVEKQSSYKRDFFTGDKPVESDRFEEKIILYRIGRELDIDQIVAKQSGSTGVVDVPSDAKTEFDGAVDMNAKPGAVDDGSRVDPEDDAAFSN